MKEQKSFGFVVVLLGLLVSGLAGWGCREAPVREEASEEISPDPSIFSEVPIEADAGELVLATEDEPGTSMEEGQELDLGFGGVEAGDKVEVIIPEELEDVDDLLDSRILAPYVPTPQEVVKAMLELAEVKSGDVVYDLGCGDGRVLITAARDFGARSVGVELNRERYKDTVERIRELGLGDQVTVKNGDLLEEDLSPATVVFIYLMPEANEKLKSRLKRDLKPGSRVVSHDFPMEDWEPSIQKELKVEEDGFEHVIYIYRM